MFGKILARPRALFADQFEANANGFLYRRAFRGAPIAVSAEERARYIAAYDKFSAYGFWGMVAALIAFATLAATLSQRGQPPSEATFMIGTFVIVGLFALAHSWAWNRPVRELRGRGLAGPAPTRQETARRVLSRVPYSQLVLCFLVGVYLIYRYGVREDWDLDQNGIWLAIAALLMVFSAAQIFRKWRLTAADKSQT